jgi:hypothetical protein
MQIFHESIRYSAIPKDSGTAIQILAWYFPYLYLRPACEERQDALTTSGSTSRGPEVLYLSILRPLIGPMTEVTGFEGQSGLRDFCTDLYGNSESVVRTNFKKLSRNVSILTCNKCIINQFQYLC